MDALNEITKTIDTLKESLQENQRTINQLCKLAGIDPNKVDAGDCLIDKVKGFTTGELTNDADYSAEAIFKVCAEVCKEVVDDTYTLYEEEPRLESDSYGDEVTITLEANPTYMDKYIKEDIVTLSMERLAEKRDRDNTPTDVIVAEYVELYKNRDDEYGINVVTLEVTKVATGEVIKKAEREMPEGACVTDTPIKITGGLKEKKAPAKKAPAKKSV